MYMNHNNFGHIGAIKELSSNELEEVDGGWIPAALFVVFVAAPFVAGVIEGAQEEIAEQNAK